MTYADILKTQYDLNGHAYHNWGHARLVASRALDLWDAGDFGPDKHREVLECAALAHDVIYSPGGRWNEDLSAEFGLLALREVGNWIPFTCPGIFRRTVRLGTIHFDPSIRPQFPIHQCLHDADLSLVAEPYEVWIVNTGKVRSEYHQRISEDQFRANVLGVMDALLAQQDGRLFCLPMAQERWLEQARKNRDTFARPLAIESIQSMPV